MKILFKKSLVLSLMMILGVILTGCKDDNTGTSTTTTTTDTTVDCDATPDAEGCEETFDLGGVTVKILHGAPYEVDPFHEDFSGQNQNEKQQLQRAVEARYNVEIKYLNYPDNAGYGPDRVNAIINGVVAGDPIGHILMIDSKWIGQLAEAEAISDVTDYDREYAHQFLHDSMRTFGSYKNNLYGFSTGVITAETGLYFNMDLLNTIGKESPAEKWNNGEWTWTDFNNYVTDVQAALGSLGDDYYAMGGVPGYWAQNMVPANGGYLVNPDTKKVTFTQSKSLNTFSYLNSLWTSGVWEPEPDYDAGSASFALGKVLIHPGDLWYVNAPHRWGNLNFDLGFVPYPIGDNVALEDYKVGVESTALYAISGGYEKADNPDRLNDEMLFRIWNDLQAWEDPQDAFLDFETLLETRYNDLESIEAHMSITDKVYFEQLFNLGISGTDADYGFYPIANSAVKEGNVRSELEAVLPVYQEKLKEIFGE
ncbi:ABC transporter substrate-binding protein [Haloplasma contractile]|uniref:ABC transporter substrate-binding protein n=1 Tax=Haloplasma contractile SSD-17B TaxID=1033810 RepID=F7PRE1_9MOLU|nr:extracellular solute-binding protein [Haloplasma contractile]ERJ11733.1 ABC transporter substrate-binding protein [Haloplasma contractile SSD-17B]